jgi:tetraacyldisaccharide 4'-kinase
VAQPLSLPLPSLVLGGLTAGGSGKTPAAMAIAKLLQNQGANVHFLSRGYGRSRGSFSSSTLVTTAHTVCEVGDEPLLLAEIAPTWVATDRRKAAHEAVRAGAEMLILDDGFYNPHLQETLKILVYDTTQGIGNGHLLPAGPLRAPIQNVIDQTDLIISIGGDFPFVRHGCSIPILIADLVPISPEDFHPQRWVAFAGIGYPDKFFKTLRTHNIPLAETHAFPDHHVYTVQEIERLWRRAKQLSCQLITTRKDYIRLPEVLRVQASCLDVSLVWRHPETDVFFLLQSLIARRVSASRD